MNKKMLILFAILFMTSVGIIVHSIIRMTYSASNPEIVIECDNTSMNSSSSMTCYVRGKNFNYGVSSFEGTLVLGTNLTLSANEKDSSWEGSTTNEGEIVLYTDTNKTGNFNIASFTINSSNTNNGYNSNISMTNVKIGNQNFEEISMNVQSISIRIKSNVNTLATLTINSNNILTSGEYTYNLTSSSSNVTIGATKADQKSTMTGDVGTKSLNYGVNSFTITVTSESGISKTYRINITRPDILDFSNNITIKTANNISYFSKYSSDKTANTPVKIRDEITTSGQITIKNSQNVTLSDSDRVGTGSKLSISLSSETKNYTIVIPGDVNGDGNISVVDVSKLFQHYRKTNIISENDYHYILAGDVVADNTIKLPDVAKLFQYVRGTISSL